MSGEGAIRTLGRLYRNHSEPLGIQREYRNRWLRRVRPPGCIASSYLLTEITPTSTVGGRLVQQLHCCLGLPQLLLEYLGLSSDSTLFQVATHVHTKRQQVMALVPGSLLPLWEPRIESQIPGLDLEQPACYRFSGNKPVDGE